MDVFKIAIDGDGVCLVLSCLMELEVVLVQGNMKRRARNDQRGCLSFSLTAFRAAMHCLRV